VYARLQCAAQLQQRNDVQKERMRVQRLIAWRWSDVRQFFEKRSSRLLDHPRQLLKEDCPAVWGLILRCFCDAQMEVYEMYYFKNSERIFYFHRRGSNRTLQGRRLWLCSQLERIDRIHQDWRAGFPDYKQSLKGWRTKLELALSRNLSLHMDTHLELRLHFPNWSGTLLSMAIL